MPFALKHFALTRFAFASTQEFVIASFSDDLIEKSIFALKYYPLSLVASSIKIYSLSLDILSNSVFASRYYSLLQFSLKW